MVKKKVISKRDKLKLNAKDIGVRAVKTFVQTLIASAGIVITATSLEDQKVALVSVLASATAAALSVIQNSILAIK
jgi:hypothetical protein